jgi:alkaline phosphatase
MLIGVWCLLVLQVREYTTTYTEERAKRVQQQRAIRAMVVDGCGQSTVSDPAMMTAVESDVDAMFDSLDAVDVLAALPGRRIFENQ